MGGPKIDAGAFSPYQIYFEEEVVFQMVLGSVMIFALSDSQAAHSATYIRRRTVRRKRDKQSKIIPPTFSGMSSAPPKSASATNGTGNAAPSGHASTTNGRTSGKKKASEPPIDPVTMYESVRSRIAALEEEEYLEEEEDTKMGLCLVSI
jgi:hypothetical protein